MRLVETTKRVQDGWARLTGVIERPEVGDTVELFYEYPEQWESFVLDEADPFVAALVIPAMMMPVQEVHIEPPVSATILEGAQRYIEGIPLMRPDTMHRIRLTAAQPVKRRVEPSTNVGAFFSLGVDSFYTLLTSVRGLPSSSPRITHLIHLHGLQEPLGRERGTAETAAIVQHVAGEVGLPLITGRTNLRDLFDAARWGRFHGAGLASVGLSLSRGLGWLLTPSAHSFANLEGIGCHALIDPLWSSELLSVRVDGADLHRVDKIVNLVGRDPLAQQYLRVCLKNMGALHNCGRCQKCVRTMLTLQLMGELKNVRTLPDEVTPDVLHLLRIRTQSEHVHAREVYEFAKKMDAPRWIQHRLRRVIRRHENRVAVESILNDSPFHFLLPAHDRIRAGLRRVRNMFKPRRIAPASEHPSEFAAGSTTTPTSTPGSGAVQSQ